MINILIYSINFKLILQKNKFMKDVFFEPYKIKMVEPIKMSSRDEREQWIKEAHYNLFSLPAEHTIIDLLTDSGTGAMSDRQWAALMLGDESYAGASSYYNLKNAIERILGFPYFMPTHQGRAAENVLFSVLIKAGDVIPGNSHFDTTKGHIEYRHATAIDCTIDEAFDTDIIHPFKGNVDINKLVKVLETNEASKIPFIIVTITNNTAGGQPVSMENLRQVREVANKFNKCPEKCHYYLNKRNDLTIFKNDTFDLIYSNIVLQHMKPAYSKRYITEFMRVLAPGGLLIFQIPSRNITLWGKILWNILIPFRYCLTRQPTMEMNCIPRAEIIDHLVKCKAIVIDEVEDEWAGKHFKSFRYCATK